MSLGKIASRYAKSLIDLAREGDKLEVIYADIVGFQEAVGNRDLFLMVKSPIINSEKKKNIFKAIFEGKVDKLTSAFFDIIIRKGREQYLPEIADEFVSQYKHIKGITSATVTTATPITADQIEIIKTKLKGMNAGIGVVELETKVDSSIVGGFVLEVEDKLYDASIKSKLAGLKKEILDNSYIKSL